MDLSPPIRVVNVQGISLTAYVLEDGSLAFNDRMAADAIGRSEVLIRRRFMEYKDDRYLGGIWIRILGRRHWTRDGLLELAKRARTESATRLLAAFDVIRHSTAVESKIADVLLSAFKGVTPIYLQHTVSGFRVDVYFPKLNFAIEIDEHAHAGYDRTREVLRHVVIEANLGCEILRWNPHALDQNVGGLINEVLRRIKPTLFGERASDQGLP